MPETGRGLHPTQVMEYLMEADILHHLLLAQMEIDF
jgi:hypothetical protein